MFRSLSLFLLSLLSFLASGQIPSMLDRRTTDSLYILLKTAEGTKRVDILNGLALHLAPRYFDSSYNYAGEALRLAEKLEYAKGKGIALFNIGNSYFFAMDVKNALFNYFEALRFLEVSGPSQELGDLYFQISCFSDRANNMMKAKNVYEILKNKRSEHFVILKMAWIASKDSAYLMGLQNLEYFRSIDDTNGIFQSLYFLADHCFYAGKPEGLSYAEEALKIVRQLGDDWLIANSIHKVVNYHENAIRHPMLKKDTLLWRSYLLQSRDILLNPKVPYRYRLLGETYRELGDLYSYRGDYKNAIQFYISGL
ncbi:MAG: hypothetical protein HGA23_11865, partial [Bacteroidales bacterium]|nr:hypothetical protein [Bacteroidales bacterium]